MAQRKNLVVSTVLGAMWLLILVGQTHAQITSNVLRRVLMIEAGTTHGTGFTIDIEGRQYLVTAKHLVADLKPDDFINVRKDDRRLRLPVKVLLCDDPIDIAVLVPGQPITVDFPLEPTMAGMLVGQEMFFLGFPYGVFTRGEKLNEDYPFPFIKKATMSAVSWENGVSRLFLDGHNNPGFSGGPIVYRNLDTRQIEYRVAGVVSGFRFETTPVFELEKITPEQLRPEDLAQARIMRKAGHIFRLKETNNVVKMNTGIVIGYGIKHAVDLIRKNPIGPKVSGPN